MEEALDLSFDRLLMMMKIIYLIGFLKFFYMGKTFGPLGKKENYKRLLTSIEMEVLQNSWVHPFLTTKSMKIFLEDLKAEQNKGTNCKGIKSNTNFGQITGIQEKLVTIYK